jgi:uroporphyrin-III C-methyltransferase / precorrin-2 dehydrogenase / sirohydrochlorin ferrochelatase
MRTPDGSHHQRDNRVILVGSSAPAVTALWSLAAAGADIRWYADDADVGAEINGAQGLGRGRLELRFDDPRTAPLDGAVVIAARRDGLEQQIAARARAAHVPVHVIGRPDLSTVALAELEHAMPERAAANAPALAG